METYGESYEQGGRRVRHADAARESYYHYLTKAKWGDLKNYHLTLNSSPVGSQAVRRSFSSMPAGKTDEGSEKYGGGTDQVPPPCFLTKKGVPQKRPKKGLTFPGISGRIP